MCALPGNTVLHIDIYSSENEIGFTLLLFSYISAYSQQYQFPQYKQYISAYSHQYQFPQYKQCHDRFHPISLDYSRKAEKIGSNITFKILTDWEWPLYGSRYTPFYGNFHFYENHNNFFEKRLWHQNIFPFHLLGTKRKLNVHKTSRRHPQRLLSVLCTFNLRLVSRGYHTFGRS